MTYFGKDQNAVLPVMDEKGEVNSHEETLYPLIHSENIRRWKEVQLLCMYEIPAHCNTTSQEVLIVQTV